MDTLSQRQALPEAPTRDLYDKKLGSLVGVPGVIKTKATALRVAQPLVGDSQTFIVETHRQREESDDPNRPSVGRDHVFIEYTDSRQHVRMYLPPEVAACIARQRDALTGRSRSISAKATAADRKARGLKPGFMKNR